MTKFDKLKQKVDLAIKEKNTYEALQIYRTIRNRCRDSSQALECLDLLFEGIQHFAKEKEETTVIDLAEVYSDTLVSLEVTPSDKIYSQIDAILKLLPANLSQSSESSTPSNADSRSKFTNDIFKWSRAAATDSFRKLRGDPALHKIFAHVHWSQGAHNVARLHFLLANDPEEFSKFLIEYTTVQDISEEDESDNFGAQAVFQLLTYRKLKVAETFFAVYCRDHPKIKEAFPFKKSPLLNFVWLLLTVLQQNNFNNFVYLLEKYNAILDGDCEYKSHLDKIAQLYFGAPAKSQSGGMFGELLKGFFPSGSEGSKEDYPPDEEMPPSAQKIAAQLFEQHSHDFDSQNTAADKVNPPGLIDEPDMFEDAPSGKNEGTKEAAGPVEMDLD